jgi:chemotaxis protein MotA
MSQPRQRSFKAFIRRPAVGVPIGLLFVLGTIAVSTGSLLALFSIEGLVIVGGGVIAVAFMSFEREDVRKALDAVAAMFGSPPAETLQDELHHTISEIIGWAAIIKDHGLHRRETSLSTRGIVDPFLNYALNMVVSGYAAEDVRAMMETAADAQYERDSAPIDVLKTMTSHAPAFGMIGTLVGMVAMLYRLNDDLSGIGASLSVAFLSTLYGVLSARMIYMPAAAKLRQGVENRRFRNQLIAEGMVMLVSNKTAMYIKDRLNGFLRPEHYNYLDNLKLAAAKPAPAHRLKVVGA